MKAWHFLKEGGTLQWPCGGVTKPEVGQILTVTPDKLKLCNYGLHASVRIIDALDYAPGPIVCRVELGGRILKDSDKVVASERTIIAMADASEVLHQMACWAAKRALKNLKKPDPRSIAAIEAKEQWLRGEITDKELDAARSAAWSAARSAGESATWSASWSARWSARSAAWSAAESAAESATESATRSAAWSATWSASWSAARAEHNRKLTGMVNKLLKEAAKQAED